MTLTDRDPNSNSTPVLKPSTLVELLRWRALHQPEQPAYTFLTDGETDEAHLTYQDLDRQARAIGAQLQQLEASGKRILLLYPPGLEYIAAFFGCLYAGAVAVPAYPPDPHRLNRTLPRLQAIVADAQATTALTTAFIQSMAELVFDEAPDLQALAWIATDELTDGPDDWHDPQVSADALAFLQYTSGSTAAPRGVMLSHANLLHNSALIHECFGLTPRSRGVIWLPPYHDMGLIGGIVQPLYAGIQVILLSPIDFLKRPLRWLQAISRYKATTSGGPGFAYDLCVRKISPQERAQLDLSSWELAFNGAEPVRSETIERFAEAFAPCGFRKEAFYPCYGLAEATLIVSGGSNTALPVTRSISRAALQRNRVEPVAVAHPDAQLMVGCGHALMNQHIAIVHPDTLYQCSPGQVGEIWVSGPSVAQGYWNQPKKTIETFQASVADTGEGPFLRTGDLGFLEDGELFVTGRLKDLIIIRGHNHYPQDIELTAERSHPSLRPGCCAAFSVQTAGEERVVVAQEVGRQATGQDLNEAIQAIRQAVAEKHGLQVYGVLLLPAGSIPKTSSGKIQRQACRDGFLSDTLELVVKNVLDVETVETPPARPEAEFIRKALIAVSEPAARQALLTLYLQEQAARVLRTDSSQVGPQQSLSALGLDSLMVVELKYAVETDLDVILPMDDLFQGLSISELALQILTRLGDLAAQSVIHIVPAQEQTTEFPLSHGQQALWFLHQLAPESAAYHVPSVVRIRSKLDVAALQRAFQRLVAHHSTLRTTFSVSSSGEPVQSVHDQMALDFEAQDASNWSDQTLDEHLSQEAHRPFDLERGPLMRVRVFRQSEQEHVLLVVMHHIITDFWSLAVLVEQLSLLYPAECAGQPLNLPEPKLRYADYVRWQAEMLAGPRGEQLRKYWLEQLSGELPMLRLPTDHPRPAVQTYNGKVHVIYLGVKLTEQLKALCQAQEVTLNMILLTAFQVLLYRYTGQEDLLIGSLTTGRSLAESAGIVGYLVNPVALRAKPSPAQTFISFLDQTRQTMLAAFEHQDYPLSVLVDQLQPAREYDHSPLFQVMFVFQRAYKFNEQGLTSFALDITGAPMDLAGLHLESLTLEHQTAQFDLTLTMGEADRGLVASFEYNTDLYEHDTIARMAAHLQTLLEGIVADPHQRLSELPILPMPERQQLLVAWNGARTEQLANVAIPVLFERQVAQTPDAMAVVLGDEQLTYRALDGRANQLAAYLQRIKVGPEVLTGIFMEPSLEMIVGILGVLKAGGAYVPLDPGYPQERLAFILADTQAPILLTQSNLQPRLLPQTTQVICLDVARDQITTAAQSGTLASHHGESGDNVACVIYTSGSSGRPKGVLLEHKGVANLIDSFLRSYQPTADDRILPLTSVASASFVGEILPLLCVGGTLVMMHTGEFLDLDQLFNVMMRCCVSIVSTVPAVIAELNERKNDLPSLRLLLSGGEALDMRDVDALRESVSIVNSYGLTETTVCSTFHALNGRPTPVGTGIPIGRPVINTDVYVLDSDLNCLPIGCPGEVYVSGAGLARGYLRNPELTAERFVPNPYRTGERMYRTGDLARWLPDGSLEYLYRVDRQVKIRGSRIELGEIEAMLVQHPAVRDAVVMSHAVTPGDKRLVAYVVPTETSLTSSELYQWLVDKVPAYMVPASFEMLDALPLTPNGKVNVKALPIPAGLRPVLVTAYAAPQSQLERSIASIWQTVLKVDKVGIQDNFFELGGNSLLIAQVHRRLQAELDSDLALVDLFKYPTIGSLAQRLSQRQAEDSSFQNEISQAAQKRSEALNRRKHLRQGRLY